jgi:hypothetical protein
MPHRQNVHGRHNPQQPLLLVHHGHVVNAVPQHLANGIEQ